VGLTVYLYNYVFFILLKLWIYLCTVFCDQRRKRKRVSRDLFRIKKKKREREREIAHWMNIFQLNIYPLQQSIQMWSLFMHVYSRINRKKIIKGLILGCMLSSDSLSFIYVFVLKNDFKDMNTQLYNKLID